MSVLKYLRGHHAATINEDYRGYIDIQTVNNYFSSSLDNHTLIKIVKELFEFGLAKSYTLGLVTV
jgi:hypothetical protein